MRFRIRTAFAAAGAAGALATGIAHAAAVAEGPMIGALSPTSSTVWVRLDSAAHVRLRYRPAKGGEFTYVDGGDTSSASDYAAKFALAGLAGNATYSYAIGVGQADGSETWSSDAWFRTSQAAPSSVSFTVLADFANGGTPSQALVSAASTRADFLAVIGDMDHTGPAIDPDTGQFYPPDQWPTVLANMRAMHLQFRDPSTPIGAQIVAKVMASTAKRPQVPFFEVWDDHDYCGNNADANCPFRAQAFQAWREYFAWPADSGLADGGGCGDQGGWQSFPMGGVATVFMLDERSNRLPANGSQGPTTLGACQMNWLLSELQAAKTTWKFILSPITFNPGTKTWDSWAAYNDGPTSDRQRLLAAINGNGIRNVIVISGDIHSGGAVDDGTHSGLPEVSVPHANMPASFVNTYCKLSNRGILISQPGTWTLGTLKEPNIGGKTPSCEGKNYIKGRTGPLATPPYPLDGRNSAGFVRVDATSTSASVQVLDMKGQPRNGVRADGSSAVMRLDLAAQ